MTKIGAMIVLAPDDAKREILAVLDAAKGNRTHAASALGVPVMTLRKWIDKLSLWPDIDALCEKRGYEVQPGPTRKPRRRPRGSTVAKRL